VRPAYVHVVDPGAVAKGEATSLLLAGTWSSHF